MPKEFMFDTNIFNHIIDNGIDVSRFPEGFNYYVTHLQKDEIEATKEDKRRAELIRTFIEVESTTIATESAVWDVSRWDMAKWGDEDGLYDKIKTDLDSIKLKKSNIQDALIAETAIKNNIVLVTDDGHLQEVAKKYKGQVITLNDFLQNS